MNRLRSLFFDALEDRKLLSRAHIIAHTRPAVAATPLVLNGTLTVNNKATTTTMDEQDDTTTTTPVAGQLGSLGEVRGTWSETDDQFGDYMGPDMLRLHDAKGTFVVAFNEQKTDAINRLAGGAQESVHPELASGGAGAYAHARGSGTIGLTTNATRKVVNTITFSS